MKRILIFCFVCLPLLASAQKILTGDLKFLLTEHKLGTSIDFSQAQMAGGQENGRAQIEAYLVLDSTYILKRFYSGVANELEDRYFLYGDQPEARYEAVVHVQQVTDNGKTWSTVDFIDRETQQVVCTAQLIGSGGRIGTFLNLWGDGMKDSGEALGKLIKKNTKK